jgi:anti-sigma regulatory factor (Ser/Thr protein kinase)
VVLCLRSSHGPEDTADRPDERPVCTGRPKYSHAAYPPDHWQAYAEIATLGNVNAETTPSGAPALSFQFSALLSATPRGARLARMLGTEQLRSWGLRSESAPLIIAELASNAAVHGHVTGRDFRLRLTVEVPRDAGVPGGSAATLRIAVTDTRHDTVPVVRAPTSDPEGRTSGHGMLLVEALADRWGVDPGPFPCKTVWAELALTE